jgi:transcriptional regulator
VRRFGRTPLLAHFVGVEIEVTRLVGKTKLGQNKEQRDIQGAAATLKDHGNDEIGNAMTAAAVRPNKRSE